MQIVMAWHRRGYWLGDIKPSNFVISFDSESESTTPSRTAGPARDRECSESEPAVKYRLFVIDLESVVRASVQIFKFQLESAFTTRNRMDSDSDAATARAVLQIEPLW